jgi:hypothetical protein
MLNHPTFLTALACLCVPFWGFVGWIAEHELSASKATASAITVLSCLSSLITIIIIMIMGIKKVNQRLKNE